jgi:outer membrane lipoprotein carrier protein
MRRVDRAYANVRSMEADFVQHLTVPLLGTNQRSEGRLLQRRPDRFAMRFTDPAGDIMVADGRHFWMYNPSVDRTQVIRTRIAEGGAQVDLQQQFLSNPTQRFVATLAGAETVNGRATHVVSLVPRGRSQYRLIRVWVDQQDNLVRRFEMTEENESVRRIELRNLRLNVDLPDSAFHFTPPAGTQVFDQ